MTKYIYIVFDGPPAPESGRFVEVEDDTGASIRVGEWMETPPYWRLRIQEDKRIAELEALNAEESEHTSKLGKQIADLEEERDIFKISLDILEIESSLKKCDCCGYPRIFFYIAHKEDSNECAWCLAEKAKQRVEEVEAENVKLREACETFMAARVRFDERSAEMMAHTNDPVYWRQKAIRNQGKPRLPDVSDAIRMIEAALREGGGG